MMERRTDSEYERKKNTEKERNDVKVKKIVEAEERKGRQNFYKYTPVKGREYAYF